jgi:deoxyribodipyrimidine photo-lyase
MEPLKAGRFQPPQPNEYCPESMRSPIHIVWFKRDLRIHDHLPLADACRHGPVLPLFAWEPDVIGGEDYARQHQLFAEECLLELEDDLKDLGLALVRWSGGILDALNTIRRQYPIAGLWSHEETGNDATYRIDKTVMAWCRVHGVTWHEYPQNGVVRRLGNRDRWNGHWEQRMQSPQARLPLQIAAAPGTFQSPMPPPVATGEDKPRRQRGGRTRALDILDSFLEQRATQYRPCMSSPQTATRACSRLSPYLAWGAVSMKEVVQATRARQQSLQDPGVYAPRGLSSGLRAFESRLHWHCHFMQKLESEPAIEFQNLHRAHDQLREMQPSEGEQQQRLGAWCKGETGWPLIDACMAMLRETGWVNFRMRAMLMSTASYLYWLHWRQPGLHLAREFIDYEPGIHWPQVQMQSGTTGINALRIYNPVKQAKDQDPTGAFVRRWLPALQHVPDSWIFQPWLMPPSLQSRTGCVIDRDYPAPLVEVEQATREARARLLAVRRAGEAVAESRAIVKKHGSRKGMPGSVRDENGREHQAQRKRRSTHPQQKELFE